MSRLRTFTRRAFLVTSVAVAGGVAFGTYAVRRPHANPLEEGLAPGEATFNPFVKVTAEAVTLIAPHADVGQGVQSVQAALIAEELDIELDQVEVSFGEPSPAYYNTALAGDAAPFMPFDDSMVARGARGAMTSVFKLLGVMATGGSSTVPDSYDKLRVAGAVARETLKAAAAQVSGQDVAQLRTERGAVLLPDGTALPYTELAGQAAQMAPVTDVALRDPSTWRLLGKPMVRRDIVAKSTGTQPYGLDLTLPGMVHAALRCNPRRGGEMRGFDAGAAQDLRGVQRILEVEGPVLERAADGTQTQRWGKVGVAVIADNTWRAFNAVNAIDIDWGPAPYPAEMAAHWDEVAASFTPERLDRQWRDDGDVEAALQEGTPIEAEYRAPYAAHAPLEPLNVTLRVDPDGAEIWTGHQMPRFVQQLVADALGFDDPEAVVFHNAFTGGSFGHRLELDYILRAAQIARQMPGTPIKLTYTREEDFAQDFPRQIGMARMRGAVRDGQIHGYDAQIATVSTTASQTGRLNQPMVGPDMQIVSGVWNMPFAVPHLRVRGYRVPELLPTSSWRSVGAATQGFFGESFFDELCQAAGADPLEERLRLVDKDVHRKVLEAVGEMSDWGRDLGPGWGRGLAFVESFGVPTAEVVDVRVTDRGLKIETVYVAADVGRVLDPVNFEAQVSGAVVWGLGHAMNAELTVEDGQVIQSNYDQHEAMRLYHCPQIVVRGLENGAKIRGIGEPPVPPAPAALANAIFAATGQRLRQMPFHHEVDFA